MSDGRVRYDPTRRQGNANYVATGGGPLDYAVVSTAELQNWDHKLLNPHADIKQKQAESKALSDASKARQLAWPDTLEAKRKQYLVDRENRMTAEERRRQILDEEEAKYQETKRQQRLEDAEKQLMLRDERGARMRSTLLEHLVTQERESQLSARGEKQRMLDEEERQYAARVRQAALDEAAEKKAMLAHEREKILSVKLQQQAMLNDMVEQRREARKTASLDAELLRQAAQDELTENALKSSQRRAAELALKQYQASQASPRLSPRQALTAKQLEAAAATASPEALYDAHKTANKELLDSLARHRQENHELRVHRAQEALDSIARQPSPRDRTVDAFSSAQPFFHTMQEQSKLREQTMAQHKKEVTHSPRSRGIGATVYEKNLSELRSSTYREKLDNRIAELDRLDDEARQQERDEAKYLAMVQSLQAAEKRAQRNQDKEQDLLEAQMRQMALSQENELFRGFIQAHLPANMSPRLAARALDGGQKGGTSTVGKSDYDDFARTHRYH